MGPSQDLLVRFCWDTPRREAADVQHGKRLAAHGVDVAERIGGSDLAEQVGVIADWRNQIHRLNKRQIISNFVDTCVVGGVKPDQEVWILRRA